MYKLNGKYGEATVYSEGRDEKSTLQIIELLDQEWSESLDIKIMPDFHAGAGCVIGTTMNIKDKIVPNLVGVDIGCGMLVVNMGSIDIDLEKLDIFINENIPSGFNINKEPSEFPILNKLICKDVVNMDRAFKSIGTLGGGNHFIEIDIANNGDKYLVIHSGSRNLGKQVADHYQKVAFEECNGQEDLIKEKVAQLKIEGKEKEIQKEISKIKKSAPKIPKKLSYLTGVSFRQYIQDMAIVQSYASANRFEMAEKITKYLNVTKTSMFETVHNYIDVSSMILRKGAVSAKFNKELIIPMNMRDGCLICVGKGNSKWNHSAPHGAGRLMSRTVAKEKVTLEEFETTMKDVYSTSVVQSTLDESPMAYKPMQEIIDNIGDTVDILEIIKPVYNFKSK